MTGKRMKSFRNGLYCFVEASDFLLFEDLYPLTDLLSALCAMLIFFYLLPSMYDIGCICGSITPTMIS